MQPASTSNRLRQRRSCIGRRRSFPIGPASWKATSGSRTVSSSIVSLKFSGALKSARSRAGRSRRHPGGQFPCDARGTLRRTVRRCRPRRAQYPRHACRHGLHSRTCRRVGAGLRSGVRQGRRRKRAPRSGPDCVWCGPAETADELEAMIAAGNAFPTPGHRRAIDARHQLHQRHDGTPQGRHVPPSRRVPAGAGHGAAHGAQQRLGLSLDPADVPLQRLVLSRGP